MRIFYFTGTGNSLAVAKKIGGELISIAQAKNSEVKEYKDDVIGFVFPTYGCTVPKIVQNFMKSVKIEADYTFAIGTYGNGKGKVMEIAGQIAKDSGYRFDYVNAVLMLDNCQPQFDIAKQKAKLPEKKVEEQIAKIVSDIRERKSQDMPSSLGDRFGTWLCERLNIEPADYAIRNYSVDGNCIKCGTCVKVCPMGNVRVTDTVVFSDRCACCQACLHACPKHAIHFKHERNTERWRNPDVTLKELIEANNQE
jgi:ferredoxin